MEKRSFIITLRAHPSETYLTHTFLTYITPFLESQLRYTYAYEESGTLSEHIHILVETNFRDKEKILKNKILKEVSNKFKNVTHDKQTLYSPNWEDKSNQIKLVAKGDEAKTLGYVHKETEGKKFQGLYSNEEILTAVDIYYKERLIDKSKIGKDSWVYLTNKQAHATIEKYCEENELHLNHPWLKQKMQSDKYSFSQLSARFESTMWTELILSNPNIHTYSEKDQAKLRSEQYKYNEDIPMEQDLFKNNKIMRKFIEKQGLQQQFIDFKREYDLLLD